MKPPVFCRTPDESASHSWESIWRPTPSKFLSSLQNIFSCIRGASRISLVPRLKGEFPMTAPEHESDAGSTPSFTARLLAATRELHQLEELVKSGNLDSRVLSEFRDAVDHIRSTTWAVQKWIGLSGKSGGDPFAVLPIMAAERVKRATQMSREISLDLQSVEVGFDTPGIVALFDAVGDLHRRLAALLKREI